MRRSLRKRTERLLAAGAIAVATGVVASCTSTTAPTQGALIEILPDSAGLYLGQQLTLHATVVGSNRTRLAVPVYWSTEDPGIVAVSSDGVVTAEAAGRVLVAASSNGMNGTATITVQAPVVASMTIEPETVSVRVGDSVSLAVTLYAGSGRPVEGIPVAWVSSDTTIATVSPSGHVTGVAAGIATILAAAQGQSATATVTVTHHPTEDSAIEWIVVEPTTVSVNVGASAAMQAIAYSKTGQQLQGISFSWVSSNDAISTVTASGEVTGVAPGTATITAAAAGHWGSATATVSSPQSGEGGGGGNGGGHQQHHHHHDDNSQ